MRLGVCTGIDQANILPEAGANYIEPSVVGALIPEQSDEVSWAAQRDNLLSLPLVPEAFNVFLPGTLRLVGPDSERATELALTNYVFTALRRAAEVGGKVIVFGSAGARRVPDGWSREVAADQIRSFLRICARATEETGVIIAIEPLNQGECNIINTVREAVTEYVTVIDHPGIRVLADTFHMEYENEPLSVIPEVAPYLVHVHTADTNRLAPGTGIYDHRELFRELAKANYTGRLSIEAGFTDFAAEIVASFTHLRNAEKEAGE